MLHQQCITEQPQLTRYAEFADKRNENRNCPFNCCLCPAFSCSRSYANCCNDCHLTDCLRYLGVICCCCSLVSELISGCDNSG
uniref:Uncharacterized protein n=1 Tax=Meloidogyne enterolobii TaxID=390850 RepID=A0A6V7XNQ5_MELEN|nr:unnamed protein product [Meloidogyne enterolobii]